jgi:hypothetical protein
MVPLDISAECLPSGREVLCGASSLYALAGAMAPPNALRREGSMTPSQSRRSRGVCNHGVFFSKATCNRVVIEVSRSDSQKKEVHNSTAASQSECASLRIIVLHVVC